MIKIHYSSIPSILGVKKGGNKWSVPYTCLTLSKILAKKITYLISKLLIWVYVYKVLIYLCLIIIIINIFYYLWVVYMHILQFDHINSNHCFFPISPHHFPKYLLPILLYSFVLFVKAYWIWLVLPLCAGMSGHPADYRQTIIGHIHKANDSPSHISHQMPLAPQQAVMHYESLLHPHESNWNYWRPWMVLSCHILKIA